jgi:hypothetical protein
MRVVTGAPEAVTYGSPDDVEVTPCPGGPLLVRGADAVRDEGGELHPTTRPVVAVCACDKSQRMPWCDGTHKVVRRKP